MDYSATGGDAGLDHSYPVTVLCERRMDIYFDRDTTVADNLQIGPAFPWWYDSGCGTGIVTSSITVAAGTTYVRVRVLAKCAGGIPATLWTVILTDA